MAEVRGSIQASARARPPTKNTAHDDPGDNPGQATEGSTLSSINCDRC